MEDRNREYVPLWLAVTLIVIMTVVGVAASVWAARDAQAQLARQISDGKVRIDVYRWPDGKKDVRIVVVGAP